MPVSVIIVNWNSGELLAKCLHHLNCQTILPRRVFVVDNASTDGSNKIEDTSPGSLKIIRMNYNVGFAAGNNQALSECTTQFVALLNADAFPEPNWIEQMLIAATEYNNSAAFGSQLICHGNDNLLDGIGDSYHFSGLVWRNRHGMRKRSIDNYACEIFSACAAAAMYRRKALVKVGGFDEDYFCYVEDVDLGFRLRLAGYKAMYIPEAVVHHIGSATTGGHRSDFSVYHGHRNLVWTYVKNMPGPLFWLLLPAHMLLNVVTIAYFSIRGQFRVILRAKSDAIKGLPKAWHKRGKIQKERISCVRDIWAIIDKHLIPPKKWGKSN